MIVNTYGAGALGMRTRALLTVAAWMTGAAAQASIVINPVSAPIASGIKVGLSLFTRAQPTGSLASVGYQTLIQSLRPLNDGSGRLFINDTRGTISVATAAGQTPTTWFDIRTAVANFSNATQGTQTGLMSFAFHPNFNGDPSKPGYGVFYTVDTSLPAGGETLVGKGAGIDHDDVIHQFTVADPNAATATITSQREVLRIAQPLPDHGPGTIAFNPTAAPGSADYGKLYIGLGDGGGVGDPSGNAQDLASPFGKVLRIDPSTGAGGPAYTIPADNPYAGQDGKLGEIYASGLRNPQQFSWDKVTGQMLAADIGQSQLEEVNAIRSGGNYGWPLREGSFARGDSADPNVYDSPMNDGRFIDPITQFDHEEIFRSGQYNLAAISGVFAYHGSGMPELDGMVVLSELDSGRIFYYDPTSIVSGSQAVLSELELSFGGMDTTLSALDGNPYLGGRVDLRMGEDATGELYVLSKTYGDIYQLVSLAVPEPETWAMMILGMAAIGLSMRSARRRSDDGVDANSERITDGALT